MRLRCGAGPHVGRLPVWRSAGRKPRRCGVRLGGQRVDQIEGVETLAVPEVFDLDADEGDGPGSGRQDVSDRSFGHHKVPMLLSQLPLHPAPGKKLAGPGYSGAFKANNGHIR